MAFILCDKHGGQGSEAVCRHLLDVIIAGERLGPMALATVEFEGAEAGGAWFCPACASRYGIPADGLLLAGDQGLDQFYAWEWAPVCRLCFRDAGGKIDQRNAKGRKAEQD